MSGWLGALAGAADSASGVLGASMKADAESRARNEQAAIEERLQAAKELRLEAAQQRMDQYKRGEAAKMGQQINNKASGVLNASDANSINRQFGSNMSAEDAKVLNDNPDARKAYGLPEDTESARIGRQAEAAGVLGDTPRQKELYDRKKDIETAARDDARTQAAIDANLIKEQIAEARAANDERKADLLQKKLDLMMAKGDKAEKTTQVIGDDGTVYSVTGGKAQEIINEKGEAIRSFKAGEADSTKNSKKAAQIETELKRLGPELMIANKDKKPAIQAQIDMLTRQKRELQGYDAAPAVNPNRKPLSAFGG